MKKILNILLLMLLISCSENSTDTTDKKLPSDYIIGKWIIDSSYVNGNYTEDGKDTKYIFNNDKTLLMITPDTKQYVADWQINNNDSTILLMASVGNHQLKIHIINDSNLIWDWWYNRDKFILDYLHRIK